MLEPCLLQPCLHVAGGSKMVGAGSMGTELNGCLVLQADIHFRTEQFKQFLKLPTRTCDDVRRDGATCEGLVEYR